MAIHAQLDFFGVMVLSFVTALAGGVLRDVLIGAVPPASLRDWRYATTAFAAGAGAFFFYRFVSTIPTVVLVVLDAAGLGLFAVAGTQKALDFRMPPLIAVLLGTITGVGGGTVRDVLLAQVPTVLRSEVYATAALAGSVLMVGMRRMNLPPRVAALAGGVACYIANGQRVATLESAPSGRMRLRDALTTCPHPYPGRQGRGHFPQIRMAPGDPVRVSGCGRRAG